jgi:uncharacterized protein (TIGR02996 family)
MPPQPVLAGLLRDAKLNPDEIAPRLILAGWLEEHGQPERAECVRLQLAVPEDVSEPTPSSGRGARRGGVVLRGTE